MPDIPLLAYLRGQTVGILQLHLRLIHSSKGVSQICGIARLIVEVAVVAQQCRHTCTLGFERRHVERVALVHQRFCRCRIDEMLSLNGEVHVSQCVDSGQVAKIDRIANLGFLRVRICENVVVDIRSEIATCTQQFACHLRAQTRIYVAHEHRCLAECLAHPFAQSLVAFVKGIVYPQAVREWRAIIRTAQYGTVRFGGKSRLHLLLSGVEMVVGSIVLVFYLALSGVQLVAVGHARRLRARGKEHHAKHTHHALPQT